MFASKSSQVCPIFPSFLHPESHWYSFCRDEIAGCSEKAYDFLTLAEAKKMMLLKTDQEVADFAGMVSSPLTSLVFVRNDHSTDSIRLGPYLHEHDDMFL